MLYRRWHWLIVLTDVSDQRLLEWALSFRTLFPWNCREPSWIWTPMFRNGGLCG